MTATTVAPVAGPGADRPRGRLIAVGLAARSLVSIVRVPSAVVPTVAMPLFFIVAFSGAFGALTDIPGFPTDNELNWFLPWAVMQGAAFAGMGICFGIARDLENGFYDRLLIAPAPRRALILGPLAAAMVRVSLPVVTVCTVGFLAGARLTDGLLGLVTLIVAAEGLALISGLWGLGVVYRMRTQRSGSVMQVGIFVTMFLSIGQVPLEVMDGWLHAVARVNPLTPILTLAREGFLGEVTWADTWPGLVSIVLAIAGFSVWAISGFRTLDR